MLTDARTIVWNIYPLPKKFNPAHYSDARQVQLPLVWSIRKGTCLMNNGRFILTVSLDQQKLCTGDIVLLISAGHRYGVWIISDSYAKEDATHYLVELILA